jgi:hypothetical protein
MPGVSMNGLPVFQALNCPVYFEETPVMGMEDRSQCKSAKQKLRRPYRRQMRAHRLIRGHAVPACVVLAGLCWCF